VNGYNNTYWLPKGNTRTIESLVRSCMKRYPVPLTAWAIGNIIHRNPASVSSKLSKMRKKGQVVAFLGKRQEILYASWDLNPAVQCWLSFNGTTNRYNPPLGDYPLTTRNP